LQETSRGASHKVRTRIPCLAGVLTFLAALSPSLTETAVANGETRTIYLYHTHTREQIAATYLVNGQYDQSVLKQLNWFLRDWRRDEPTNMDPRLFDVVWEVYRSAGASEPIRVVSAYRSPETNAMLRRRSRGVAKYSQHMLGKAMDTTMPGMPMERVREIGMRLQRGGVGYYPTAGTPFVHLDVGSVRSWPRMTYEQLARLFPDGKTVHLPTNGQPLARYEEARAELEATGGAVYVPAPRKSRGFFAFLFGGGNEEDEDSSEAAPAPSTRKQWASLAPRHPEGAIGGQPGREGVSPEGPAGQAETLARAASNLPQGETELTGGPAVSANAPVPPNRPAAVASLEVNRLGDAVAGVDQKTSAEEASAPLPPRRPVKLISLASAPLPPMRPATKNETGAANALAKLVDVTGSTQARFGANPAGLRSEALLEPADPHSAETPQSARTGSDAALSYAAAASIQQDAPQTARSGTPTGLRAAAVRSARANLSPPRRPDLVAARLDRSNFHDMTGDIPASQVCGDSVLGSAISAPRTAARAEADVLRVSSKANFVSHFAMQSNELPIGEFAPR
jgi:uncharacterized protein YcbK (DUF882 family)